MHTSTRRAGLAAAALVATAALCSHATTTSASSIEAASTFPERDDVLIEDAGYFIAGSGFTDGTPDGPATLTWLHSGTFGTAPELTGKLHFDGVGNCARVRLVALNADGSRTSDDPVDSDPVCPPTESHFARDIELNGEGPLEAPISAAQVRVVLQTEPSPGNWVNAASETFAFGPDLDSDSAQIKRAEWDLGSGPWEGGGPTGSASVEWVAEENGTISVHLNGTLYAREADDTCGRIEVRYKDADGDVLETRQGTEHCMDDDDLTEFPVSNGQHFAHHALRQVTYAILSDGVQIGATTVELGDPLVLDGPVLNQP